MEKKGKYLVVKEDGTSKLLKSKKEFNKFIKDNNCTVIS